MQRRGETHKETRTMKVIFSFVMLLFSFPAWLSSIAIMAHDSANHSLYSFVTNEAFSSIEAQHRSLLEPKPEVFPYMRARTDALRFQTRTLHVAGQTITRSTPLIDGLVVEGADGIQSDFGHGSTFNFTQFPLPHGSFRLSAADCMEAAIAYHHASTLTNPYVERTDGYYDQIWLLHFDEIRPVYKIRLPTLMLADLKDIYVDADTKEILRVEDVAQFVEAPANVFVYAPASQDLAASALKTVMLPNLIDVKEDGFLTGEYLSVRTCCRYYTCPSEGECTDDKKRCALKSHANAQQTRELLSLPTDTLGLDAMISLPPSISVDSVRCTYLPFARASHKSPQNPVVGFFDKPIDEPGIASEMDRFSEIQAYYSVMSFFNNVRNLLNDKTWCLRKEAMSCNTDGSPTLNAQGIPENPYRVFVNQLIPDMKLSGPQQADSDNFIAQALSGRGSRENPIVLNDFSRFSNAAFVPALSTLKKSPPRADEILSDLIKPYDHNVFFQGDRDFAYDGDVVFHEFMHAVTTSLVGKLNSLGLDKWGIHSEPGGLNEATSDYFAAAFNNNPQIGHYANVLGGYGEVALRNIDNQAKCPADVIGEIHNDGLIWSGSLWEIRTRIEKEISQAAKTEFDRAVIVSLAQATTTEDFKTQSDKLVNNLKQRPGLSEQAVAIAEEVFKKRGIRDCFRAITLSSVDKQNKVTTTIKPMLFVPSKNQIGLKNYAPSTAQLEIGIPAGAKSLTLTWRQYLGATGALLGTETTPETTRNMQPLSVVSNYATPIEWRFQKAHSIATDGTKEITTPVDKARYEKGAWHFTMPIDSERCEQKTLYLSLLSNDFKYVLQNLSVHFEMDQSDDRSDCDYTGTIRGKLVDELASGCSTYGGGNLFLGICIVVAIRALALFFSRRRRLF